MARNVLVVGVALFAAVVAAVTELGDDSPSSRRAGSDHAQVTTWHPPATRPRPAFA